MGLIDSHAHIDAPEFDDDRADVIARAREAGVEDVIIIGAGRGLEVCRRALDLAATDARFHATIGIHPHDVVHMTDADWEELPELAAREDVVAIGETGLDFYYDHSPHDVQLKAFERFVELSRQVAKPVICHIRDAHAETKDILAKHRVGEVGGVIHCFTGTPQDALDYLALGMHISFSGIATFKGKSADPIRAAIRQVGARSLDRLMIETDCPYLAPVPMRGKRNEPAFLVHTAEAIAAELQIEAAELAESTALTTRSLFALT
jgi:TatD DNase family protein